MWARFAISSFLSQPNKEMQKTTNSRPEDLLMLDIRNQMGDLSGGSASSTSSSSFLSCNSSLHSHSPSSSEGFISFGTPSSSSSVNQPSPLASSSSVNQPSPLASFSVNQPSPSSVKGVFLTDSGTPSSSSSVNRPSPNPTDERVVEYQGAIREEMAKLMPGRDHQEILVAAERIHGGSANIGFLRSQLRDLVANGTESEAFKYGIAELANENLAANFAAMHLAESPLDQFGIHPLALALGLGLFLFLVFLFLALREVWKNRTRAA